MGILQFLALLLNSLRLLPIPPIVAPVPPIVLIPGVGGSVLETKVNFTSTLHCHGKPSNDWQVAWLSFEEIAQRDCLLEKLAVYYDPATGRYSNATGVEVRPHDFGGVRGIAAVNPDLPQVTSYFQTIIDALKSHGYVERLNLFGAPYDFRLAADGLVQNGYFDRLKALIEAAVAQQHRPAVILSHSLGSLVALHLLTRLTDRAWRDQHIHSFIAMGAPFRGSVASLKGSISGDNFDIPFVPHSVFHPIQATAPSGPWLFPDPALWGDEVLVRTAGGDSYAARDIPRLLEDLGLVQQAQVYPLVSNLTLPLPSDVEFPVHCIFGSDMPTDKSYLYGVQHLNASLTTPAPVDIVKTLGDGTVQQRSLVSCSELGSQAHLHPIPQVSHMGVLKDPLALQLVLNLLNLTSGGGNQWGAHRDAGRPFRRLLQVAYK